jgi:tripartite-type tricarboxylate transporter receptor subunit TctC
MIGPVCATLVLATGALAQNFPTKPITMVVGWPAGGGQDQVARVVAEHLKKQLASASIVVNNVPGAAGSIGVRQVEQAAPDGHTVGTLGLHVIAQSYLNPNATDIKNMDPLAQVNTEMAALTVRTETGIDSLAKFLEVAKSKPGAVINGNDSPGGFSHLNAEFIERKFGIKLNKVGYQGFAPTVAALLSGEVMSATLPVPLVAELHKAGRVKLLAVAGEERHFNAPDVPTFKELGHDYVFSDNVMIFGPKGIPAETKKTLEAALLRTLSDPDFAAAARKIGLVVKPLGSADSAAVLKAMDDAVYPVMLEAGLVKVRKR